MFVEYNTRNIDIDDLINGFAMNICNILLYLNILTILINLCLMRTLFIKRSICVLYLSKQKMNI